MAGIGNKLQIATTQKLALNNKMLMSLDILHSSTVDMRERIELTFVITFKRIPYSHILCLQTTLKLQLVIFAN